MRKCVKCLEEKEVTEFYIRKSGRIHTKCKDCDKAEKKQQYLQNKDYIKERVKKYRETNLERILNKNKEKYRTTEYRAKENLRKRSPEYKKYFNDYIKNRKATNPEFKITRNLRNRIQMFFRYKGGKPGSAIRDLGCSVEELKSHIEAKFYRHPETGIMMSWDNYGKRGWHVDHIIALAKFDLTDREQFLKACHYTNLQPLWAEENEKKNRY